MLSFLFVHLPPHPIHYRLRVPSATEDKRVFVTLRPRDFPGGPMVDSVLPLQGAWVQSLVRELRSHIPCDTAKNNKLEAES